MENVKNDEAQAIKVEGDAKEVTGGTAEADATPPVADEIAEKEPESKEKVQEQDGGYKREGEGPSDGTAPEVAAEPIEEPEDNLADPEPVLRRSSRTKAPKRHAYDEGY